VGGDLLHGLVDPEVHGRAHRVTQSVQVEASVQTTDAVSLDDLLDGLDSADARLVTKGWVASGPRSCLSSVGNQNGGLHHVLGELKGT
jgi:hypothetical protein